jgi:hypothetical protein
MQVADVDGAVGRHFYVDEGPIEFEMIALQTIQATDGMNRKKVSE